MWENLDRVDWARLVHAYGRARNVPQILRNMIADKEDVRTSGWRDYHGSLNHQGDFYDSTVAAIPFLVEALAATDTPCRAEILDSLRVWWRPVGQRPPGRRRSAHADGR